MARVARAGRNDLCPCGSGRKYKRCCEHKITSGGRSSRVLIIVVGGAVLAAILAGVASFSSSTSSNLVWSAEHGHYHNANGSEIP